MESNLVNNQNQASVISIENIVKKQSIFFEIPPYQRLYEWDKEQIQTLLNDIKTKFDENKKDENKNKEYFIGNVVVSKKSVKNDQKVDVKHLLIDGQQRLTTLFLIGFYLSYKNCDNWQNFIINDNKLRISMPIREKEEEVLKEFAKFCEGGERKNDIFLQEIKKFPQDICQNIPQALETIVNWFKENIKENTNEFSDEFSEFSKFIYSNVKFVFVELAENTDLNRFFIRMNNRGKQLEKHEILKARLLSKFNDEDESKRTLYAHIWDICSQMDNYIFQKASDRKISSIKESDENDNSIDKIIQFEESFKKPNQDEEEQEKFKSIVDFPTFLLHVYKLTFLEEKQNENNDKNFTIDKNKLLEIIKIEEKESTKTFMENLLIYRILFDYFVIKGQDDEENSYKIRRLTKNTKNNTYSISEDSNVMPELAMVQNYLRVARSGMSNNHHHWLTPFLKFLDKEINLNFSFDGLNDDENIINKIQIKDNINFDDFITKDKNYFQKNTISFLENLDTALAKEQLQDKVNEILQDSQKKDDENFQIDNFFKKEKCILDQGTATPHYWFYRLEYYLWKYSKMEYSLENNVKLKEIKLDNKTFDYVASSFYFRNLNSIEHVQAQSKAQEWKNDKDKIDNFGNLALISSSFNSSLNNQDVPSKYRDFQKRYVDNKKAVISLKLWLIYALSEKDQSKWTFGNAQTHKEQMLEILKKSFESS
ncbi:DUF262 domain-containing protein [Campylobacter lari]|uniref:DUF262 domain-containing protein n=1 Tax=Campylobacter lari (strain RM2100 / D67 / ATCC BAA-1060) TaxID=306263 RepID=B9KCC4_CAMLR|nr:DUF262 domain-containing protein [Campylobacter lari]ACM64213.1 hypothetical protein (DUF262 domain) [Campylobacter lari RM2100]EAJ0336458.1 DUF262 domain-containing protein [Campylobacter lari]EAK9941332.1 DUF262 domain-containing protein [Campylobacter lari]EHJ7677598.1 DUF262 domain-containing protein [Campylobacter lari]EKN7390834.1 DUF262 domain-containing protein [Campylobacter lari]